MTVATKIGARIKSLRIKKKLSQKELSEMIFGDDTHYATISRLENGSHEKVRFDTVYKALLALDIDLITIIDSKK